MFDAAERDERDEQSQHDGGIPVGKSELDIKED